MHPVACTIDLGRMPYEAAYGIQCDHVQEVQDVRESRKNIASAPGRSSTLEGGIAGRILLVEHDPVITISGRSGARDHLLATPDALRAAGVAIADTDRGGDITYHGPGQLIAYPILDLNLLNLRLHDYLRLLERAVIAACAEFGLPCGPDPGATGVWTLDDEGRPAAKICAMGVRVRRWVSMHGLALNVSTNLDHFGLIVPCGLTGRTVTSLERELGSAAPTMTHAKRVLARALVREVESALDRARAIRAANA